MENKLGTGKYIGKYLIEERVGRGGMAEVYKAYHENLNRHVAIKVMHTYLAEDDNFLARFQREARAMAAAEHPNIVHVYDFDFESDYYYIVMEYLSGGTLKDKLDGSMAKGQSMKLSSAVRIILEMADALAYAHSCGMIHRDMKPANIMFNERGSAVLTDFGIAKLLTSTSYMTNTGAMIGTPAYMSPEQGLGEPGDERSDIYSLGVLAYHLLTGRLPHEGDTPLAVVLKHINDTPIRPTVLNPDMPQDLERIILKAVSKSPDERYQSANEMANELRQVLRQDELLQADAAFPTSLLENQPTPLPGKTLAPLPSFANEEEFEYYKNLPTPPPDIENAPTMIGDAGFVSRVPVYKEDKIPPQKTKTEEKATTTSAHTMVSANPPLIPDWMVNQDTDATPRPDEILTTQAALKLARESQIDTQAVTPANSAEFKQEMSKVIDRLTDNPDPVLSTGHMRRNSRRVEAEAKKKREKSVKAGRYLMMVLVIVGGISLGVFAHQNFFDPAVVGENPVQRFNAWLNDTTGGQTAEEVDLSGIEAEDGTPADAENTSEAVDDAAAAAQESTPLLEGRGVIYQISGYPAGAAQWRTAMEVELSDGSWATAYDWESELDPTTGRGAWAVNGDQVNGSLYRLAVYDGTNSGEPVAISDPFLLPQGEDEQLELTLDLQ